MVTHVLFNLLGKIAVMVLFGYLLKKTGIINEELQKGLSNLLLKAILPASILSSSANEFSKESAMGLGITAIACSIYYLLTLIICHFIGKSFKTDDDSKKIFVTMSVFANVGFMGFPVISELFGSNGMLYAVIYNMIFQLFFFTYGINLLSSQGKLDLSSIFKSPVTLTSLIAIIIYISPYRFPSFINESLSTIGEIMVPLSMMIIGCTLVGINLKDILKDKYSYLVSLLRLIIFPIATIVIFKLSGVKSDAAPVIAILTALPSGSLNVILAQQYDCNPQYAARTVIQSMLLMIFTLPFIILLAMKVLM